MKYLLIFILFSVKILNAQNTVVDSLVKAVKLEKRDTAKLRIYKELVGQSSNVDIALSLKYAKEAVAMAEKTNNAEWKPVFYEAQGRNHANMVELDSAMAFFDKASAGYKAINNTRGEATTKFKIAWVYKRKGEVDKALNYDLAALKLMELLDDKRGICDAMSRVADDLMRMDKLKDSKSYIEKAIAICEKYKLESEYYFVYMQAGDLAINSGEFINSLKYYDLAKAEALKAPDDLAQLSDVGNARGNALKKLKRYAEALKEYSSALASARKVNYQNAFTACLANLGEVNMIIGNYEEALKYQLETIKLMEAGEEFTNLTENYLHISNTYEKLGNLSKALEYQKKALDSRDKAASIESDAAMAKMLTQYETEKKEARIEDQEKQIQQQQLVQWLGLGIVILLIGFIIFGLITFRNSKRKSNLIANKNAENELLLKEIHHRVKNNLEIVSSLLSLQSAQIDDDSIKDAMMESQNRVKSIGIVHQKLYQGSNLGAIEMKEYFINLSESILDSFGAEDRITLEFAMDSLDVDIDTAVPIGLIVNELLTNTIKYAFPNKENGKVSIKLEKNSTGILRLEVTDNGVGKSGIIQGTGFGGQLISLLTRQLNGTMKESNNNGTQVIFDFAQLKSA